MSLTREPQPPPIPPEAYYYSVIRVMPDPVRGEFANVGLALVDEHGEYAKLQFNYSVQRRLEQLGARHLTSSLLETFGELTAAYDTAGHQPRTVEVKPPLRLTHLGEWARENASLVRVTAPRVMLADDPESAFSRLFSRHVRAPTNLLKRPQTPEGERAQLRDRFLRALGRLPNFDRSRIQVGLAVPGLKARHWVDVAVLGQATATAVAHALPLGAAHEREVYLHRGTILDAAQDLPSEAPRIALYNDPPADRVMLLKEARDILVPEGVLLVGREEVAAAASQFDETLFAGL